MQILDTIVIGGGQAGLGSSYYLKEDGRNHLVLEQGRIGETWLSQRWDSFKLNTLNSLNALPGMPYEGAEADGFWKRDELVEYFQHYVDRFQLPVRSGVRVTSVTKDGEGFLTKARDARGLEQNFLSRTVVVASGSQNKAKIPPISRQISAKIEQLHTCGYRNPGRLPPGAVVIAGSGQSGVQIAEELLRAGRRVYLCTSRVPRTPRRYRGRDILEWMGEMKFWETRYDSLADKSISRVPLPQISGLGRYGHTVSLQGLGRQGAVILGRLHGAEGESLILGDEAAAHVRYADQFSQKMKDDIDAHLKRLGLPLPPQEADPADEPDNQVECVSPLKRLDLGEAQVGSLIWATGFKGDFTWLELPVLDENGTPVHKNGISAVGGLVFVGLPWLVSRKSGIIHGITEDAWLLMKEVGKVLGE